MRCSETLHVWDLHICFPHSLKWQHISGSKIHLNLGLEQPQGKVKILFTFWILLGKIIKFQDKRMTLKVFLVLSNVKTGQSLPENYE